MTNNITLTQKVKATPHAKNRRLQADLLRFAANLSGLFGVFFILFTAGASDAGMLEFSDLILRIILGASMVLLWRALTFFAAELERIHDRRAR